jgi:hypothetical protein
MPNLGSQFDNTYWADDKGNIRNYSNPYSERKDAQGMLFHPGTATQSYSDPAYTQAQRYEDIKSALKPQFNSSNIDERDALGVFIDSKFPKQEFETKPPAVQIGNMGIRSSAAYASGHNKLFISENTATDLSGDRTAFAHEWGHKVDSDVANERIGRREYPTELEASVLRTNRKTRVIASPISEGVADAYGDRYGMKQTDWDLEITPHEDALNPQKSPIRAQELNQSGYGVTNKYWKNKQQQALYAATRLHVAMNGKSGIESLPNIEELASTHLSDMAKDIKQKEDDKWNDAYNLGRSYRRKRLGQIPSYAFAARHLYLGKLASEQPAVHEGLRQLGLEEVSNHAQAYYKHHAAKHEVQGSTQPAFPGMQTSEEVALQNSPLPKPMKKAQLDRTDLQKAPKKQPRDPLAQFGFSFKF